MRHSDGGSVIGASKQAGRAYCRQPATILWSSRLHVRVLSQLAKLAKSSEITQFTNVQSNLPPRHLLFLCLCSGTYFWLERAGYPSRRSRSPFRDSRRWSRKDKGSCELSGRKSLFLDGGAAL